MRRVIYDLNDIYVVVDVPNAHTIPESNTGHPIPHQCLNQIVCRKIKPNVVKFKRTRKLGTSAAYVEDQKTFVTKPVTKEAEEMASRIIDFLNDSACKGHSEYFMLNQKDLIHLPYDENSKIPFENKIFWICYFYGLESIEEFIL